MAIDDTQKLLIGLGVAAIVLWAVNRKSDPETAERRDAAAEGAKTRAERPEASQKSLPEQLFDYLNTEGGAYRKFQRDFDQWYAAMGVAGREDFGWPVGDHLTADAAGLQKRARTHIDELLDLGAQKETVAECKKRDEVLTYALDENNRAKNMQMVREEINQRYQQVNVSVQNVRNDNRSLEFNSHTTQSVHLTEVPKRGGVKRSARTLESGTNSAPTTEVGVGGEPFAKQRRIDGPGEIQTITQPITQPTFDTVGVTYEDEGGDTAVTEAVALPGKDPPPPKKVPRRTETHLPPVSIGTEPTMNTVPKPKPVDARDANAPPKEASKTSQKRKREESRDGGDPSYIVGGDTNESQLASKEKRQKGGVTPAQFAQDVAKGKTTSKVLREGDRTGINGTFDAKIQALAEYFRNRRSVKTLGLAYYQLFDFVPLGDESGTGYYTNIKTGASRTLEKGPNTMFQKVKAWQGKQKGGAMPENEREVAYTVLTSPEYQRWLTIVQNAKKFVNKQQKGVQGAPNTLQPKAYYEKLL